MENSLELFHPKKSELIEMTAKYSELTIAGIDDREWYKAVHDARMTLVKARTGIKASLGTKEAVEVFTDLSV